LLAIVRSALGDIISGIRMRRVWLALASEDIGDQHRRTRLGPLWLLINYLAFAGTFIFIMGSDGYNPVYAAYVATGLLVWFYIAEVLGQGVNVFVREEAFIRGTTLPLTVYVMRALTQTLIRSAYALAGCLVILYLADMLFTPYWAWAIVGMIIIVLVSPAAIIVSGFSGAFFPDSQYIIANVLRIGMFLTPIFWSYDGAQGARSLFSHWNPFTYFLEVVRMPIIDGIVPFPAYFVCIVIGLILWAAAILLLGTLRRQVAFVL